MGAEVTPFSPGYLYTVEVEGCNKGVWERGGVVVVSPSPPPPPPQLGNYGYMEIAVAIQDFSEGVLWQA